jgi:hypothetical protein
MRVSTPWPFSVPPPEISIVPDCRWTNEDSAPGAWIRAVPPLLIVMLSQPGTAPPDQLLPVNQSPLPALIQSVAAAAGQ